jgi:serine/threonine protein kinase
MWPPSLRSPSLHTDPAGPAPDAFGPFRVLHQIGAGALGPVFRAFDPDRDRLVAVKWLTIAVSPGRLPQLVAELERLVAAELVHPAIAAPIAVGTCNHAVYVAQEYMAGDSLDVAVRQYGPAPPGDALRVAAQLAGALDFAAAVNIGHGALHPRDVLLSPEETRITGIGIAHALESVGVAAPVRRPYTPPERLGAGPWDRRADVFSLAALMHEMLWGRRLPAAGGQAVASLTDVPGCNLDALRAVFARALAEQPGDRFDTALAFAEALTEAFPGVAIAASPPSVVSTSTLPVLDPIPPAAAVPSADAPAVERQSTSDQGPTATDQRPGTNGQRPAPPDQRAGSHDQRPTTNDYPVLPLSDAAPVAADEVDADARRFAFDRGAPESEPPLMVSAADEPADLELRAVARARYEDVESAPAIVEPGIAAGEYAAAPSVASYPAGPPISALDRSRSAIWPIVLALIVGAATGFAGGYGVGSRDRSSPPAAAAPPSAASPPAATVAARDWTESAVTAPVKPPVQPERAPETPPQTESKPAPPPQSDASNLPSDVSTSGRLLVRSTPAGATVFVDGRAQGTTPAAVRDLSHGLHRVRVERTGYVTEERRITITASRPAQSLTVPLAREHVAQIAEPEPATPGTVGRFVGALSVDSRPAGARVFIDGKAAGTTPLHLAGLRAGEHVLRLERDGYRRWSSLVRVVSSEQNRVTASLEK